MPRTSQQLPWKLVRARQIERHVPRWDRDLAKRLTGRLSSLERRQSRLSLLRRYSPIQHATGVLRKLAREACEALSERAIEIGRWRRIMGLLATIAEGDKAKNITLSDGRRVQIFRSKARRVDFLASGPRRSLSDFLQRMREGEALARRIDVDMVRVSQPHLTAINGYYAGSERSRALQVRSWVNDLKNRLQDLRKAVIPASTNTPLGSLARQWLGENPVSKIPSMKWLSLATWLRENGRQEVLPSVLSPPKNDGLMLGSQQASDSIPSSSDGWPTSLEQRNLAAQPISYRPSTPRLDEISSMWTKRFERMSRGEGLDLFVLDQSAIGPLIKSYASTTKSLEWMQAAWDNTASLSVSPVAMWEDIMLWCLYNKPYQALRLLNTTIRGEVLQPPRYMVNDCLTYLALHFVHRPKKPDSNIVEALWDTVHIYLNRSSTSKAKSGQTIEDCIIYWLLNRSDDKHAQSLLRLLIVSNVSLHVNTLLHFLDRSIGWGTLTLSVQILRRIAKCDIYLSSDRVQAACIKIIRTRIPGDIGYRVQTKIVTELLEMGIVPKVPLNTAIILNAGEAGDFKTAWQIYQIAKANGLVPNAITYGVLLKCARLSGNSLATADAIKRVISEIQHDPPVMQDLRLLSDVMAAIALHRSQASRFRFTFQRMLALYKRYCDLSPLRDLCICGPSEKQLPPEANINVQSPTPFVLGQMMAFFAITHSGEDILIKVYDRYHALVLEGHPLIAQLAQYDFTANAFTKAFGYNQQTLKYCTTVLKHMLDDPSGGDSATSISPEHRSISQSTNVSANPLWRADIELAANGEPTLPQKPHPPTVRTWSILLWAYLRNGQKRAADKILQIMKDRGVRPDKITWSTLVTGYARMQDVDATVDIVDRMQAAGYEPEARTIVDLGGLWERRRLVDLLNRVTSPAESETETLGKVEKQPVELATSELDAERRKHSEAELYLSHNAPQL